jgi:hypothetical protein
MIFLNNIDNDKIILKIIDNNNISSLIIKIYIKENTLINFKNLYQSIHKNINFKFSQDALEILYNNKILKFISNEFEYTVNKMSDICEIFDKIIINLMIQNIENEDHKKI